MLRNLAKIFGWAFLGLGILGFIPGVTANGHLFGLFEVDALHNLVHLVSGAAALYAGYTTTRLARLYFQVFGVVYAFVAILGLVYGDRALLGVVAHNPADTWLHALIAIVALYAGFAMREREVILGR